MSDVLTAVRAKYPEYKDVSDNELALSIADKYPDYLSHSDFAAEVSRAKSQKAELDTVGEAIQSLGRGLGTGAGALLKGMGAVGTPEPRVAQPPRTPRPGVAGKILDLISVGLTPEESQRQQAQGPALKREALQKDPLYQMGEALTKRGQELKTSDTLINKVAEFTGGFLPMALSGPLAPATIGIQAYGGTIDEQFSKYKQAGLGDEEAASRAMESAELTGLTQTALWMVLPKPLKTIVEKATGRMGTSAIQKFLASRVAGGTTGFGLGASSRALENITTGEPIGKDVVGAGAGMGVLGAIMEPVLIPKTAAAVETTAATPKPTGAEARPTAETVKPTAAETINKPILQRWNEGKQKLAESITLLESKGENISKGQERLLNNARIIMAAANRQPAAVGPTEYIMKQVEDMAAKINKPAAKSKSAAEAAPPGQKPTDPMNPDKPNFPLKPRPDGKPGNLDKYDRPVEPGPGGEWVLIKPTTGGTEDAIQERSAAAVPVGETPGDSGAVGARVPAPEKPAEAQAKEPAQPYPGPSEAVDDRAKYDALNVQFKAIVDRMKANPEQMSEISKEMAPVQQQIEDIKNKYGGMPPPQAPSVGTEAGAAGPEPVKVAEQPAVPEPAKPSYPEYLTKLWDDTEPPPKGIGAALHESRFKGNQPSRESVINYLNEATKRGVKPEEIIAAIKASRNPSGVISKVMMMRPKTPAEIRQETAPAQQAQFEPKTPEETDVKQWIQAFEDRQDYLKAKRDGWQDNEGRPMSVQEKEELEASFNSANEMLAGMQEKYGERQSNPYKSKLYDRLYEQIHGMPRLKISEVEKAKRETAAPSQKLNPGDKVTRVIEGKVEHGTVVSTGARLHVQFGDDPQRLRVDDEVNAWTKEEPPVEAKPAKPTPKFSMTYQEFLKAPREGALLDELRKVPKEPDTPEMAQAKAREKAATEALENAKLSWAIGSIDPKESRMIEQNVERLSKAKRKIVDEYNNALNERVKISISQSEARQKVLYDDLVKRGIIIDPSKGGRITGQTLRELRQKLPPGGAESGAIQFPDFLGDFADEIVSPVIERGKNIKDSAKNLIIKYLAPTTRATRVGRDILFESKGYKEQVMTEAAAAMEKVRQGFSKMSQQEQIDFIDRIKTGTPQPTPALQDVADLFRKWDDRMWAEQQRYKPTMDYLEDHFRVFWKVIPGSPEAQGLVPPGTGRGSSLQGVGSRRPWRGTMGQFRQHVLPDISEGIRRGGVPVSYNPAELFMLNAQEAMKFVSANRAWEQLKANGEIRFVKELAQKPDNMVKVDDAIARVNFIKHKMLVKGGEWYINKGTGLMLNNYLSKDYIRQGEYGGAIGRGLLDLKNATTAIELGVSPFHAAFVTNEAVGSSLGLGIQKMATPGYRAEGLKQVLKALPETIPGVGMVHALPGARKIFPKTTIPEIMGLGEKVQAFAKNPAEFRAHYGVDYAALRAEFPEFDSMVDDLFTGGGQIGMHEDYKVKALSGFKDAIRNNKKFEAMVKAIPAINQATLSPIFNSYIPRIKLGTFMREYSFELARNQNKLVSGEISRAELARKTWSFIEDRFGELNWDNLYWNRTFKSAMQLAFRSVTWKLGNVRGFGRAIGDWAGFAVEAGKQVAGRGTTARMADKFTAPMAWTVGMALVTTIQATVISKVLSGKYPWELAKNYSELTQNLTFPRVDKDDPSQRVSIPTYYKDLVHFKHHPWDYFMSSMSGEIGRIRDVARNKDFYGTEVRNEDDPWYKQWLDSGEHLVPLPFSISSMIAFQRSGAPTSRALAGYAGYTKAPYYMSHSPAELKAAELLRGQLPEKGRTKEQAAKSTRALQAVMQIKRGVITADQALAKGLITDDQYDDVTKRAEETNIQYQMRHLNWKNAMKIWRLASPEEKEQVKDDVAGKLDRARPTEPEEIKALEQYQKEFDEEMAGLKKAA